MTILSINLNEMGEGAEDANSPVPLQAAKSETLDFEL